MVVAGIGEIPWFEKRLECISIEILVKVGTMARPPSSCCGLLHFSHGAAGRVV
jgi:hypothetical protein